MVPTIAAVAAVVARSNEVEIATGLCEITSAPCGAILMFTIP